MGQASTVARLPDDIRRRLQALLADPRVGQLAATAKINAILEEEGRPERLSKSAVNRYALRMAEIGKRLAERHEVAEMWVTKFGRLPQGQMGQLIVQMVHGLAFDAGLKLSEGEMEAEAMPATVRMLKDLAIMLEKTERAASLNADREAEVKRQAAEELVAKASAGAKSGAITPAALSAIVRDIYGV